MDCLIYFAISREQGTVLTRLHPCLTLCLTPCRAKPPPPSGPPHTSILSSSCHAAWPVHGKSYSWLTAAMGSPGPPQPVSNWASHAAILLIPCGACWWRLARRNPSLLRHAILPITEISHGIKRENWVSPPQGGLKRCKIKRSYSLFSTKIQLGNSQTVS